MQKKFYTKIMWYISLVCCLLALVSCQNTEVPGTSDTPPNTPDPADESLYKVDTNLTEYVHKIEFIEYYKGALYFHNGDMRSPSSTQEGKGSMVRYNIETGNLTYVCGDPLCSHMTEECAFGGGIQFFTIVDDRVICRRTLFLGAGDNPFQNEYMTYNMQTMESSRLLECHPNDYATQLSMVFHDGYWYYWQILAKETETGEFEYTNGIVKMDLQTGDVVYLSQEKDIDVNTVICVIDDRLYFSDAKSIFSTDLNMDDKQVLVEGTFVGNAFDTDGTFLYYGEPVFDANGDKTQEVILHRYDLASGEHMLMDITARKSRWYLTEKYLYYIVPPEAKTEEDVGMGSGQGSIWRCRHDGSEKEKVFDLHRYQDGSDTLYATIIPFFSVIVDDAMYTLADYWEDLDGDGKQDAEEKRYHEVKYAKDSYIIRLDFTDNSYEIIPIGDI